MSGRLLGVVLCGGKSMRMGRDKALIQFAGKSFFRHAYDRLKQACDDVALSSVSHYSDDILTIPDCVENRGPAIGISCCLKYAIENDYAGCLVTPVDTPFLTVDDLLLLRDRWSNDHKLIVATSDRLEPLIGVYPVALAEQLEQLSASEDRSLYRWIKTQDYTPLPFPAERTRNVNSPEDLTDHGR